AVSQIAVMGAPLATNAISVPAPAPISILPATIACVILLPPVKSTIVRSSPCFLKMPSLSPTLTGMTGSAFGAALPTVSVAAAAGVHPAMIDPIANAASNRPRPRILTMVPPSLSFRLLGAIGWIKLMTDTTVRRGRNQIRCVSTNSNGHHGAPAGVDPHVAAINPAQLLQALQECRAA